MKIIWCVFKLQSRGIRNSPTSEINLLGYAEYDGLNRLVNNKDQYGNIIKNTTYNYGLGSAVTPSSKTMFYNNEKDSAFTKNDGCPTGTFPTTITYTVPYGKYVSTTQAAADAKALEDIVINGQANANQNGQCLYRSAFIRDTVYKSNCTSSQGPPTPYFYRLFTGAYTSTISQADADAKAAADTAANAQRFADSLGSCSCMTEGYGMVGGSCVHGTRLNDRSVQEGRHFICYYHYYFSDGSVSEEYQEVSGTACPTGLSQN